MSPAKFDKCIVSVKKSIKKGKIPSTYINKDNQRVKSNPYAICYNKKTKGGKKIWKN